MTRVATYLAVAVLTASVLPVVGIRARMTRSEGPEAVARTTAAPTRSPTRVSRTTATEHRVRASTPTSSTTTTHTVAPPRPKQPGTTTTSDPAQLAAERAQAVDACLQLAAADNLQVVAANQTWFHQQLSALTAHRMLDSPQYAELQFEESQTQTEIQAQYAIDKANCYIDVR